MVGCVVTCQCQDVPFPSSLITLIFLNKPPPPPPPPSRSRSPSPSSPPPPPPPPPSSSSSFCVRFSVYQDVVELKRQKLAYDEFPVCAKAASDCWDQILASTDGIADFKTLQEAVKAGMLNASSVLSSCFLCPTPSLGKQNLNSSCIYVGRFLCLCLSSCNIFQSMQRLNI